MTRTPDPMVLVLLAALGFVTPTAISQQANERKSPLLSLEDLASREKQAGDDPAKLLDLAPLAEVKEGRRLLHKVFKVLLKNPQPAQAISPLRSRCAELLSRLANNPEEVKEVLDAAFPKQIARQIFYRRYREQWIFDHPFRMTVVFDGVKGKDLRLQSVQLPPAGGP